MIEKKIPKNELTTVINFLSSLDFFKKLNKSALKELANSMSYVSLAGGETLIHQGYLDATMYILLHGRLRVFVKFDPDAKPKSVADISVGQIVGEIALLTNVPRTGTVRAIRDSVILKLNKAEFQKFEVNHPHEVIEIAKTSIKRLISRPRPTQIGENIITISVAPAGDSNHIPFVQHLVQELNKVKPTFLVNREICNQHFGSNIAQTGIEDQESNLINDWLISLEQQYGFVIYETDRQMTPWTHRCLRQADRVFLVAEEHVHPAFNSIELSLFSKNDEEANPYVEIVFIHPDDTKIIKGTHNWLKSRKTTGFHHIRLGAGADFARLVRFLTGQAFGVVLSGGGARGFAHIGILHALEKLKIPIDFIGGTSMGAFMGAIYIKHGISELAKMSLDKKLIKKLSNDYTLPLVSLLSGKHLIEILAFLFDDLFIEDLWTRFFCVSSNISKSAVEIHSQGLIKIALRATSALPAVYPPIYENGNMLVDGGILDNMPVEEMRKLMSGGKILAIRCSANNENNLKTSKKSGEIWVSGWQLLFNHLNPLNKTSLDYDTILDILHSSLTLSAEDREKRMAKEADYFIQMDTNKYGLLEFERAHEIYEEAYGFGIEKLPSIFKEQLHTDKH